MPDNLYYTQRIRGFQQQSKEYRKESLIYSLRRTKHRCPRCGSAEVVAEPISRRSIRGEPMGSCREVRFEFTSHRLYCRRCKARTMEHIPFLSHPKAQITRALERTVLDLRQYMSLRAVATYFRLRWHTIKELEKKHLRKRFSKIHAQGVKAIGIDEIHVGNGKADSQYLTIVRDLDSGAVLYVGDGKGIAALAGALKVLKKSTIRVITMDMANALQLVFGEFP